MTEMICIVCPRGCRISVDEENNFAVAGNACPRGEEYGKGELISPSRTLTTTVRLEDGVIPRCPVRTSKPIPKDMLMRAIELVRSITLTAPVTVGEKAAENIFGTGADIIVTRSIARRE